jgi:hypothetical protein
VKCPEKRLKHLILGRGAFDERNPDPEKDYGIGGLKLCFAVVGARGAVELEVLTKWYLPHIMEERMEKDSSMDLFMERTQPIGTIYFHSRKPQHEDSQPVGSMKRQGDESIVVGGRVLWLPKVVPTGTYQRCKFTRGICYTDSTSLGANPYITLLVSDGPEELYKALEERYREYFWEDCADKFGWLNKLAITLRNVFISRKPNRRTGHGNREKPFRLGRIFHIGEDGVEPKGTTNATGNS